MVGASPRILEVREIPYLQILELVLVSEVGQAEIVQMYLMGEMRSIFKIIPLFLALTYIGWQNQIIRLLAKSL